MNKIFNVKIEFNHTKLENTILRIVNSENEKGYCCFVDLNSLVVANKDSDILKIINNATVNSCDGSYIAIFASKLHKKKYKEYIGPDFFEKFIYYKKKHLIIGNTEEAFNKVKAKVELKKTVNLEHLPLPFKKVNEFNYLEISETINNLSPDFIWVSLGAPKQEVFMSMLLPNLERGMLLGVGAAINYFSGEIKDIPKWIRKVHLIWVYRLFTEPKKQYNRLKAIFVTFPKIIKEEKNKIKNNNL